MEATGVYWIPLFEILDARGFDVRLVNAQHVKNVPGRKSDVSDCEWLRELQHRRAAAWQFPSRRPIVALRALSAPSADARGAAPGMYMSSACKKRSCR